ncbi:translocon subunit [Cladophialophora chaetospira]|uniref:Translocon subunit n=1 Tax=Cladophialophora chaetospira TaxID=386627 RepID=A0AA38WYB2_9EURO|nr:translocon subunit [Cladophialophora chaetospira]
MDFHAIATVVLGGLAIGLGHSLIQAIRQIKASCSRESKSSSEAPQPSGPTPMPHTMSTSLEQSIVSQESQVISSNDILRVNIPDPVLALDAEVDAIVAGSGIEDYLNIDIPEASFGWDELVETIAEGLDSEACFDGTLNLPTEVAPSYQQDICQVSEINQAAGVPSSTSTQPSEVSKSTSLTLWRPSTYLNAAHIAHFSPSSASSDAPSTCAALIVYKPAVRVNVRAAQFTITSILQTGTPFTRRSIVDTTPVTIPLQDSPATSSQVSVGRALVLYRPPFHLDSAFRYNQIWSGLLAVATSDFWQDVLVGWCIEVYRNRMTLDMRAVLCRLVVVDSTARLKLGSSTRVVAAEDALHLANNTGIEQSSHDTTIACDTSSGTPSEDVSFDSTDEDTSTVPTTSEEGDESCHVEESVENSCCDNLEFETDPNVDASETGPNSESSEEETEIQQLREALEHQQSVSQSLRSQLLDREAEMKEVKEELGQVKHFREMLEIDSDDTEKKLRSTQQELLQTKQQLRGFQSMTTSAAQQQQPQVTNPAEGFNVSAIMTAYKEACKEVKAAEEAKAYIQRLLNDVVKERDHWKYQNQAIQKEYGQQLHRANAIVEHQRGTIEGMDAQMQSLLQQKAVDRRRIVEQEDCIKDLQAYNGTLLKDFTNKLIEDPQDTIYPFMCTHNEARDLRNQVESAQATSAQFIKANQELAKELEVEQLKAQRLQIEKDHLVNKCAQALANYEVLEAKVEHWMDGLPGVVKAQEELSEEEAESMDKEFKLQSKAHVVKTKTVLKKAVLDVSDLQSKLATMERNHKAEVADLEDRISELKEENNRMNSENFDLTHKLHTSEENARALETQVKDVDYAARQWRDQCERQVHGDMTTVVQEKHREELDNLKNQNWALQHMNTQLAYGKETAVSDVELFKWSFVNSITRVREMEAEWVFARQKCDAMEERFKKELREDPLRIEKKDAYEGMSFERKQELLREDDRWIVAATGIKLGRGHDTEGSSLATGVLSTFMADARALVERLRQEEEAASNKE